MLLPLGAYVINTMSQKENTTDEGRIVELYNEYVENHKRLDDKIESCEDYKINIGGWVSEYPFVVVEIQSPVNRDEYYAVSVEDDWVAGKPTFGFPTEVDLDVWSIGYDKDCN